MRQSLKAHEVTQVADRVELTEEMLTAAAGDKYSAEQISTAVEQLARGGNRFSRRTPTINRLPPGLVAIVHRERILAAMLKAASELDYPGVTINAIARRAGVSRTTFYVHFENVEDCFLVALDTAAVRLRNRMETAALEGGGGWRDQLRAALAELLRFVESDFDAARSLIVVARGVPYAFPRRDALLDHFAECLNALAGKAVEGPPVPSTASAVIGGIETLLYTRLRAGDTYDMQACLPEFIHFAVLAYEGRKAADAEFKATRGKRSQAKGVKHGSKD